MKPEEYFHLLASILGGGLIVAVMGWVREIMSQRVSRRVDYLTRQLQGLYGPLHLFCSQNRALVAHSSTINKAYKTEYCDVQWSTDTGTQTSIKEETTATIEVNNQYARLVLDNNKKMVAILADNYSLVDPEDEEAFQVFFLDFTRHQLEFGDDGLRLPLRIFENLGNVAFYREEFANLVRDRFNQKSDELNRWRKPWAWRDCIPRSRWGNAKAPAQKAISLPTEDTRPIEPLD